MKGIPMQYIQTYLVLDPTSPSGLRWGAAHPYCHAPAGSVSSGYWCLRLGQHGHFKAHRIVWALKHGRCPGASTVDHKNGDSLDNRPSNLRLASRSGQSANAKARARPGNLPRGVVHNGSGYLVQVAWAGQRLRKHFPKGQLAAAAELAEFVRQEAHGEFAR